jgi:DNA-binding MarR family transcriptional regulator
MVRARTTPVKTLASTEVLAQRVDPLFLVWLVARSTEDLMDTVLRQAGVTGDEFALYSVLAASPGITPSELSRWMAAPATTVSSYVKRLEARGHLVREAHPSDRRSYRIHLTAAGRRTHRAAAALFGPFRAHVIDELAGQELPVEDSLLFLREVVDGLRATAVVGPQSRVAAGAPATAGDQDMRQPPGE